MKIFEHPNMSDFTCPICLKGDDKPVTLIGIAGTAEGNNMQAEQFHVDCIDLLSDTFPDGNKCLFQILEKLNKKEE